MLLIRVFEVAGVCRRRRLSEQLDEFNADQNRMPMPPLKFRNYSPGFSLACFECLAQNVESCGARWRAIDESNHRGVPSAIDHLIQTNLQRTELTPFRSRIDRQKSSA